jgi:hypothetical protein
MDKVKVDENLRELVSTNLDGIDAMQKNSPEIYSAFEKLLTAIDNKYGSGLATKNLGYLGYVSQQNVPTGNLIPLNAILIDITTWYGEKRVIPAYTWAQLETALDFIYYSMAVDLSSGSIDNSVLPLRISWENGLEIAIDLQLKNYMQKTSPTQTLNNFIEEVLKRGADEMIGIFTITTQKSVYKSYVGTLSFQLINIGLVEFNFGTVNGVSVNSWMELQTYILNSYQLSATNPFKIFIAWKDTRGSYVNIDFNLNDFLTLNKFGGTILSAPSYIGYVVLYDILRKSFGCQIPSFSPSISAYDLAGSVGKIWDYDFGNGYEIYREIEKANSTLLKVNNPSTTTTTPKPAKTQTKPTSKALSMADYIDIADWTPKWKSRGDRPSPTRSASAEKLNNIGVGNDGQIYIIKEDKNGVKRWTKGKTLTIDSVSPKSIDDKNDLLRAVAILQDMLDQSQGAFDKDEIQEIKDQQANLIMEYTKR